MNDDSEREASEDPSRDPRTGIEATSSQWDLRESWIPAVMVTAEIGRQRPLGGRRATVPHVPVRNE